MPPNGPCTVNGQLQQPLFFATAPLNPVKILASHFCFKENEVGVASEEHSVTSNHADKGCRHSKACEHRRAQPECVPLSALFLAV